MRRPLKPFVTEYKQSNRRGPAPSSDQTFAESERPAERASPRLFDLASNESEDSYEAAMRAADALFSSPTSGKTAPEPAQARAMSAERQTPNVERTPVAQPATAAPEKPGGRILRVLDEAPDPKLLALEAELAPRRRGRKPGSKNKPKPALTMQDNASDAPPAAALVAEPVPVDTFDAPAPRQIAAIPAAAALAAPRGEKKPADQKFPWVRDRLRPGEDWKRRRLPRVCW